MNQEVCDSIFDLAGKCSRPGTRKEVGSGLGLTVAKEFAHLNGGNISITSREGAGTEVVLSILTR